jgi:arabinose-5-phosphate isomerase
LTITLGKENKLKKNNIDVRTLAKRVLTQEIGALEDLRAQLDYTALENAIELILDTKGIILVVGAGTSSSIARRLAHVLTCFGGRAVFLDPGQSQHGYSMLISSEDVVIAFSRGGETAEVNHVLKIANQRGAKIIGIMEDMNSTMASHCDVALQGQVSQANDPWCKPQLVTFWAPDCRKREGSLTTNLVATTQGAPLAKD